MLVVDKQMYGIKNTVLRLCDSNFQQEVSTIEAVLLKHQRYVQQWFALLKILKLYCISCKKKSVNLLVLLSINSNYVFQEQGFLH